jgi:hypothetical protein
MDRKWTEKTLEAGDVWDKEEPIEGKFVKTETNVGPNGSNMYTIETDKGEMKVWGSTVLDDKLLGVIPNTYVKIEYEGKLRGKKGNEYHSYKVFIDLDSMPQDEPDPQMPPDFLSDRLDDDEPDK